MIKSGNCHDLEWHHFSDKHKIKLVNSIDVIEPQLSTCPTRGISEFATVLYTYI